ncbi:MAG TPA: prolyl oligopeptidase family serine peptidase [Candidatus Acidoferrales bacterium]|nr:prolyl oligopeptidase family serine peptidase [Candidatus Acidoferrales bacterium]
MRSSRSIAVFAALILLAAAPQMLRYPPTPRIPVVETYSGVQVVDPYRWLEDDTAPKVIAWAQAQTAVAQSYIESQPSFPVYLARVRTLAKTGAYRYGLVIRDGRYIYMRGMPPQEQDTLVTRDGLHGAERVLFDPNASVSSGQAPPAIESVFPSLDGSKVAFTTQQGGSEEETLHVVDVATGKLLSDVIPHAGGGTSPSAVIWDADGNGFIHTRWPLTGTADARHFNIKLYHHILGTDPATDTYVFGDGQPANVEYYVEQSADGNGVALFADAGDGVFATVYVKYGNGSFQQVASPADEINCCELADRGAFVNGSLDVVTSKWHSKGDVVNIPTGKTFAQGTTIVSAGANSIDNISSVPGGFITREIDGGDAAARYFDPKGGLIAALPLPPVSTVSGLAADPRGGDIILRSSSYTTPGRWLSYERLSNRLVTTGIEDVVFGDYSKVVVKRVFVPSTDGTARIPLEIVALSTTKLGPNTPTIMSAYGSYGTVSSPFFLGSLLAWLEHGGVFAQAMIRGGGEYGEAWHQAAVHATVYKRSDDLAACARWLATHGYSDAQHLGIFGGSAGGYLMGLALTRNPSLYRAVNSDVGFYSELREVLTPNGAFNIPEFGDPNDPKQFPWVYAYSPYYHVTKGVAYPAILMETGENDPRVNPRESRKMIAMLQAASSSSYPILLWQKSGEGHGIGNSFDQRVHQRTEMLTFFESQLR